MDAEEDRDMEDLIDPTLYEPTPDSTAAVETPELDSDHESSSGSALDEVYAIDRILAKWKNRRKILYFVQWSEGGTTWLPAEDVLDEKMIKNFEISYQGFKEGIEVVKTRIKNNKVEYFIRFTDYKGSDEDAKWWVPEKTMHPDLRIKGPKKMIKRRKTCQY
ncbi:hypothetical protein V8C42DRAFT_349727 [Trichoderma barbatum]